MKCLLCESLSFHIICQKCLDCIAILPSLRLTQSNLKVYSFYSYQEIAYLLDAKYDVLGSRIFHRLAQKCARYFFGKFQHLQMPKNILAIPLDDHLRGFYSHTAVITRAFAKESQGILTPQYSKLLATNHVSYAGKDLRFRQANPRNFVYKGKGEQAVLFDDIITTGITLSSAHECLQKHGVNVLFAITLTNART
ncbi:MAG: ComF family protein [Helicobacter sp.]|uniref:ComF family protein n=1 Tax=Helicobacter sp. 10-6591 TaxID=2004998 RepID=UPI0011BEEF72|nr:ComF family protein [Helicobacter sp. 10-6591]MCI6217569.1 ComF family protein [Helicobacter sp.]MCI7484834.1 ComF family protein [Helicobacter sp.]MDD7567536.1 ComF family protein [Helicobacter sp.]MDY5740582.1 ComF family protein [Helicobacter sp.]